MGPVAGRDPVEAMREQRLHRARRLRRDLPTLGELNVPHVLADGRERNVRSARRRAPLSVARLASPRSKSRTNGKSLRAKMDLPGRKG